MNTEMNIEHYRNSYTV